jgi:hypothetical protein
MDPNTYMTMFVEPTVRDFEGNPSSPRLAFLACIVTFHSIDYITHPKSPANRRETFRAENADFAIVDRVAHAFKHVEAGNLNSATNRPLTVEDVIGRPPAFWGHAVWDLSRWDDQTGGVEIASEGGDDLLHVVKRAADFLRTKC